MINLPRCLGAALAVSSFAAGQAEAQAEPEYQIAGIACVPAAPTVRNDLHVTNNGALEFAQGSTGRLSLLCPITVVIGQADLVQLKALVRDPDGADSAAGVEVSLRRISSKGQPSEHPGGRIESDACSASGPGWKECVTALTPADLNFHDNYYFFRVTLRRSSRTQEVAFGGIKFGPVVGQE